MALDIVGGGDPLIERRLVDAITETVDWDAAAEALVKAFPGVEALPLSKRLFQLGIVAFDEGPNLVEHCSLHPVDLAVEMRRALPDRATLD